jgi:hypothetical protein
MRKDIRITFRLNAAEQKAVRRIQQTYGLETMSEAVRRAIETTARDRALLNTTQEKERITT